MIEQENLDLEKKRSCLRFQILKAGGRKGCFCSSLLFSPLVIPSTFLVLTGGGGESPSKTSPSTIISYVSNPFFQLSPGDLVQDLSKLLRYKMSTEKSVLSICQQFFHSVYRRHHHHPMKQA